MCGKRTYHEKRRNSEENPDPIRPILQFRCRRPGGLPRPFCPARALRIRARRTLKTLPNGIINASCGEALAASRRFDSLAAVAPMPAHGRISSPSQAKHLPLWAGVRSSKTRSNFCTEYSGVNNLSSGTFP